MTSSQQSTIIAVFPDASTAQAAAKDLMATGVSRENIYLETSRENTSTASTTTGSTSQTDGLGTATTPHKGGVGGWFKSLFGEGEETEGNRYQEAVGRGNVILSVHAREDQYQQIADILERHNPIDIHENDTATAPSTTGTTVAAGAATAPRNTGRTDARNTANTGDTINVVEEELQVGKRNVLRGGVRVYSRVVERPVEESINLSEDHVRVDRRPVDRPATDADFAGRDNTIEVQEYAEEAVVGKTARVVEEIRVGKETTQRTENIHDTVRHTEVDVEQIPGGQRTGAANAGYDDTDFRNDFQSRYGSSGGSYDTYAPSYRYGYEMANDPRYKGRSYDEVESQLKSDYGNRYPNSTWEKMKDSVRYGWNKVSGRTNAANR